MIHQFKKILIAGFQQAFEMAGAGVLESTQNECQEQGEGKELLQQLWITEEESDFRYSACEGKELQTSTPPVIEKKRTDAVEKLSGYTLEPEMVEGKIKEGLYKEKLRKIKRRGKCLAKKKTRCKRKMKLDLMKLRWQTREIKVQEYKEKRHLIVIAGKTLLLKEKKISIICCVIK
ncbi:UNVERIFIED_CONTAM: hypothetical protein K2H54_055657 [Gekko kuhli]